MLYMYVYISYDVTSFNTYLMHIETQNCYVYIYVCVYIYAYEDHIHNV